MNCKTIKQLNREANYYILDFNEIKYIELNNGAQLNIKFNGNDVLSFYPSTNKWVNHGDVYQGDADKMLEWIKKITGEKQ